MSESNTSLEAKIAVLTSRIDHQARFTRMLVVVCTAAVLGVQMWGLTQVVATLPPMIIAQQIQQIDSLVYAWKATEASMARRPAAAAATNANAGGTAPAAGTT